MSTAVYNLSLSELEIGLAHEERHLQNLMDTKPAGGPMLVHWASSKKLAEQNIADIRAAMAQHKN